MTVSFRTSKDTFQLILGGLVEVEDLLSQLIYGAGKSVRDRRADQGQNQIARQLLQEYIARIEAWLPNIEVVDGNGVVGGEPTGAAPPMVLVGSTVELVDSEGAASFAIRIVGPRQLDQVDTPEQTVSVLSPLGRALLLAEPGGTITVTAPVGNLTYKVKSIRFGSGS